MFFKRIIRSICCPLTAEEAKEQADNYLKDSKIWDRVTKNKILEIERKIKKLSYKGFYEYHEYNTDYNGENIEIIKNHFEKLGYQAAYCKKSVGTYCEYLDIEIYWNKKAYK